MATATPAAPIWILSLIHIYQHADQVRDHHQTVESVGKIPRKAQLHGCLLYTSEELADDDAQHDGDEQLRQQSELEFFLFHKNKILLFLS